MEITKKELKERIRAAVEDYIAEEETYDDNAQLQIDPETFKVTVVDSEDAGPEGVDPLTKEDNLSIDEGIAVNPDVKGMDYYDVMDLVKMSPDEPGKWIVDEEAVSSVADDYVK